jgi:hypothetical protein
MPRFLLAAAAVTAALTLSGCSVFYPNWGATGLPEEPFDNAQEVPGVIEEETPEPEVGEEDVAVSEQPAEEATSEPQPALASVNVEIVMAVVEQEFGVLTVIAQIPGIAETGGSCELKFLSGGTERIMKVSAERSSNYTQCFPIELPLDGLPAGNALVTVSYESERYTGRSAASAVVIP